MEKLEESLLENADDLLLDAFVIEVAQMSSAGGPDNALAESIIEELPVLFRKEKIVDRVDDMDILIVP